MRIIDSSAASAIRCDVSLHRPNALTSNPIRLCPVCTWDYCTCRVVALTPVCACTRDGERHPEGCRSWTRPCLREVDCCRCGPNTQDAARVQRCASRCVPRPAEPNVGIIPVNASARLTQLPSQYTQKQTGGCAPTPQTEKRRTVQPENWCGCKPGTSSMP